LALNNFEIESKKEIKKLLFYYFYLVWKIEFENNYYFSFRKEILKIDFKNLDQNFDLWKNHKQYFDLWKNEHFINNKIKKLNIIDFFINFTYECSELYAFKWEHFPLFKWLINKLK
jgi:hypothetical protein